MRVHLHGRCRLPAVASVTAAGGATQRSERTVPVRPLVVRVGDCARRASGRFRKKRPGRYTTITFMIGNISVTQGYGTKAGKF